LVDGRLIHIDQQRLIALGPVQQAHGYRETFPSSAINAAQLSEGIKFRGATALFTWPSAASTFDYGSDRESALWSRDAFEDLLKALSESPSGGRVHIVVHSM
jgi:esterase/lipase superfamily enzyme